MTAPTHIRLVAPRHGQGLTTIAVAMAAIASASGRKVTLVSPDFDEVCAAAGVGYGGQDTCFMMIMQTYLEGNVFKVGLAESFGVAASPVPSDLGADVSFGLFWGPGGISDNSGASIGLALGAVLEEGLEVGVSWGIPTSIPNPDNAIPGISISIGVGGKVQASLSAGYTQVIGKI